MNDFSIRVLIGCLSSFGLFLGGYYFGSASYNIKKRKAYDFLFSTLLRVQEQEERLKKKHEVLDQLVSDSKVRIDKMESELKKEQLKAIHEIKRNLKEFKEKHGC